MNRIYFLINFFNKIFIFSEKQKYVIKDYPELTVGSYLQSKNVKEQYLSSIKTKDIQAPSHETSNGNFFNKIFRFSTDFERS